MAVTPGPIPPLSQTPPLVSFPDGDVILRSNNGDDFRVHRIILTNSSPVFRDMLNLPQPINAGEASEPGTLSLDDDTPALNSVLKLLYHMSEERNLHHSPYLNRLFEICDKYDIRNTILTTTLLLDPKPLHAWALAARYGLDSVKQQSIIRVITMDDKDFFAKPPSEVGFLSGLDALNLVGIRYRALDQARRAIGAI